MTKEITVLYQDCVLCGDKRKKKALELEAKGYTFRKVSFTTKEGERLSNRAVFDYGIGSMPVFFYGDRASATLMGIIDQIEPKNQKATKDSGKKSGKIKKTEELKDGADSEI